MIEQLSFFPPTRLHDGVPLRSATTEERAKDRGQRIASAGHWRDLQIAREIARELGSDGREVCADDIRRVLAERHPDIEPGNWMGSCFRGGEWEPAGWIKSRTPGSHSNRLVAWRLAKCEGGKR